MDTATLVVISTVAQTVVLGVTLIVFILQFRSQEKAVKESSYQGLMGRYNDFISQLVDKPELTRLLLESVDAERSKQISEEEASVYGHLLLAYGIIEEAYLLYRKKWIDEKTWQQWSSWLEALAERPQFVDVHNAAAGTFDQEFEYYISNRILKEKSGC